MRVRVVAFGIVVSGLIVVAFLCGAGAAIGLRFALA